MIRGTNIAADIKGSSQDPFYSEACAWVSLSKSITTSDLRRHLQITGEHAAALLQSMEGIFVGPINEKGRREVLPRRAA